MQAEELQNSTDDDPGDDFDVADDVPAVRGPVALHLYWFALLDSAGAAVVGSVCGQGCHVAPSLYSECVCRMPHSWRLGVQVDLA